MKIYNSLSHQKETFKPLIARQVKMYVCGPTVYDLVHIGNARPYVVFDTLSRLLQLNYQVTYVRNITDVDDKINARADKLGISISELTAQTTKLFHQHIKALNTLTPSYEPLATQHIKEMLVIIKALIEKGNAYEANNHVLFSVASDPNYGCLAKRSPDEMLAGARVEIAPYKRDPADFVLWKPSDDKAPGWDSPWGYGRPGWHLECSAMSCKYLGETFDIHGGGQDLIFPHHENEIAQSTCAFGIDKMANYWMHNGMLTVNGAKMAKSLGNFITLKDALENLHSETIRLVLLGTHYRQDLDWTESAVEQAKHNLDRFYTALRGSSLDNGEINPLIVESLEDDLNTPLAISHLHELASAINTTSDIDDRKKLQASLRASGQLMGILYETSESWFAWQSVTAKGSDGLTDEQIADLVAARNQARDNKNFAESDRIRDELTKNGIVLEDTAQGTLWRRQK